ncbi:hypothetical protein J6590_036728 [Homalodisca vitripennis]|nr:hypothetical protein J6590_036728 [Homalodisca vitripennis]
MKNKTGNAAAAVTQGKVVRSSTGAVISFRITSSNSRGDQCSSWYLGQGRLYRRPFLYSRQLRHCENNQDFILIISELDVRFAKMNSDHQKKLADTSVQSSGGDGKCSRPGPSPNWDTRTRLFRDLEGQGSSSRNVVVPPPPSPIPITPKEPTLFRLNRALVFPQTRGIATTTTP